jgi:hypothetical protein
VPQIRIRGVVGIMAACSFAGALPAMAAATLPEFLPPKTVIGFTGGSGKATFQEKGGGAWIYAKSTMTGEISGPKSLGNVAVRFSEGKNGCDTKVGELSWSGLNARLGYIEKGAVGLALESPTQPFAVCKKEGKTLELAYGGAVVGRIEPTNVKTKKFTLTYSQTGGSQALSKLEGEEAFPLVKGICESKFNLEKKQFVCIGLTSAIQLGLETKIEIETAKEVEIAA